MRSPRLGVELRFGPYACGFHADAYGSRLDAPRYSETTDSPQHKLHWLAEQALSWSGLPVVTVRPTVFLEGFFHQLAAPGVRASNELALPMGGGKTSPISAVDVARAVAVILDDPAPHIGQSTT
jgi:uncharacterized protein YbjT (DUF2867 family)